MLYTVPFQSSKVSSDSASGLDGGSIETFADPVVYEHVLGNRVTANLCDLCLANHAGRFSL